MNAVAVAWIAIAVWVSWPDMATWQRVYIVVALVAVAALFAIPARKEERWKPIPSMSRSSRKSSNT